MGAAVLPDDALWIGLPLLRSHMIVAGSHNSVEKQIFIFSSATVRHPATAVLEPVGPAAMTLWKM
jgi:hypothetical protein